MNTLQEAIEIILFDSYLWVIPIIGFFFGIVIGTVANR